MMVRHRKKGTPRGRQHMKVFETSSENESVAIWSLVYNVASGASSCRIWSLVKLRRMCWTRRSRYTQQWKISPAVHSWPVFLDAHYVCEVPGPPACLQDALHMITTGKNSSGIVLDLLGNSSGTLRELFGNSSGTLWERFGGSSGTLRERFGGSSGTRRELFWNSAPYPPRPHPPRPHPPPLRPPPPPPSPSLLSSSFLLLSPSASSYLSACQLNIIYSCSCANR